METKNKKIVKMDMKQYGMFFALIAIYLIFAVLTKGANLSPMNINNLIMQNGYVVILAIGMLLCVLTGNIDLGVGSVVAVCGSVAGIIMIDLKMNMWVAIIAALLVGLLTGIFAGFFIQHITQGGSFIDTKYFNPQIADLISSIIIYSCAFMFLFKTFIAKVISERKNKSEKAKTDSTAAGAKA